MCPKTGCGDGKDEGHLRVACLTPAIIKAVITDFIYSNVKKTFSSAVWNKPIFNKGLKGQMDFIAGLLYHPEDSPHLSLLSSLIINSLCNPSYKTLLCLTNLAPQTSLLQLY